MPLKKENDSAGSETAYYSDEIFVEQVKGMKFPDYSNYTCVKDVYQDFVKSFYFWLILLHQLEPWK